MSEITSAESPPQSEATFVEEVAAEATLGAGTVVFYQDKVLLVQLNYGPHRSQWILPGGRLQPGEHPDAAAARETLEESGIEVRVQGQIAVRHRIQGEGLPHDVYWVFLAKATQPQPDKDLRWPEGEIMDARFWDIKDCLLSPQVRPLTQSFVRMGLAQNEQSLHQQVSTPQQHCYQDMVYGIRPIEQMSKK